MELEPTEHPHQRPMARPLDRLAAFIVDLVFLYPILQLIQAPWVGKMKTSVLAGDIDSLGGTQALLSVIGFFVFVFYRGSSHYFFNKTLGKKLLSIEVHWESKTLAQAFLRPIFILIEFGMLLIPLLGVMTHFRRRSFHDRICDTYVFSKSRGSVSPSVLEIACGRLGGLILLSIGFALSLGLLVPESDPMDLSQLINEDSMDTSCALYSEIYEGTMSSALEAFALQRIDEKCLGALSKNHVWEGASPTLSYLGLSLALRNSNRIQSLSYQKEICENDGKAIECNFLNWIFSEDENSIPDESLTRKLIGSAYEPNFFQIFLVDRYLSADKNQEANSLLRGVRVTARNQDFLQTASVYNLLRLGEWDSAFWIFQTSNLDDRVLLDFFEDSLAGKKFSKAKLKNLLERFYPKLQLGQDSGRFPASQKEIPSKIQVLWQNLGG